VLTLAASMAEVTLEEAAQVANLAAGVVVGKTGTATADAREIIAYYQRLQ